MPLVGLREFVVRLIASTPTSTRWMALGFLLPLIALVAACAGQPQTAGSDTPPGLFPVPPVTEQGQLTFDFYPVVFWIAVGVFILVEGLLIWIVLRYRRQPSDTELPTQTHGHNVLEIIWTLIPAIIVTGLFVFTVNTLAQVERTSDSTVSPDLIVDVTGFQWQWTFEYPLQELSFTGAGTDGPVMALPINETVRIRLHAEDTDVIHSFYVPQFLYKKDVVPGRVNEFDVVVRDPGTYAGQCAEFCGLLHANMRFTVEAMTRADFDAWVTEQQQAEPTAAPPPPDATTVALTSVGIVEGFDPTEISIPADKPWVVELTNTDTAAPHDFSVRGGNPDGSDWQGDPDAQAGGSATYQPPPLPAGTYEFYCSLHPNMIGTLQVGQ